MKAVMISIRPEWCEKIANGRKTIEVRKSKPKLETPFKCYIYCTKPKRSFTHGGLVVYTDELYRLPNGKIRFGYSGELMLYPDEYSRDNFLCGKVIGEFVCDRILDIFISCSDPNMKPLPFPCTGLTDKEIMDYLGNGVSGYGWHISELKIYDEPRNISEFCKCGALSPEELDERLCDYCSNTDYGDRKCSSSPNGAIFCEGRWCDIAYEEYLDDEFTLNRPPQSWCYVEG